MPAPVGRYRRSWGFLRSGVRCGRDSSQRGITPAEPLARMRNLPDPQQFTCQPGTHRQPGAEPRYPHGSNLGQPARRLVHCQQLYVGHRERGRKQRKGKGNAGISRFPNSQLANWASEHARDVASADEMHWGIMPQLSQIAPSRAN